jgi:hypothetical protein
VRSLRDNPFGPWWLLGLGVLAESIGAIWILQGTNVMPGSLMSGQALWAVIGGVVAAVGLVLVILALRHKADNS